MMWRKLIFALVFLLAACGIDPAERNNTGNDLSGEGEYEDAVLAYQAAQVAEPENLLFYFNSAGALAGADRVFEAEAALQLVILGENEDLIADAWYNLGNIYFELENYDSAIGAYRETLLIDPSHEDARYNLELANAQEVQPSPTSIEMQSELEQQQVNPSETPTPNPAGQVNPTPTPTPRDVIPPPGPSPENIGDDESGEISPNPSTPDPIPDGDMDVEDAEELLEPIEASQERISTFRENYNETGEQGSGRDW